MPQFKCLGFALRYQLIPIGKTEVRVLAFEKGRSPDQWPGVSLKPEFAQLFDLVDGPALLCGAVEREEEVVVSQGGQSASTVFRIRRVGDEFAYVHEIGLALVSSDARKRGDVWVHELEARLFEGSASIGASAGALPFFRLLRPGAQFVRGGMPISIDSWGEAVTRLGHSVQTIEKVVAALGLDLHEVQLGDLRNQEFAKSLGFLEAVLIDNVPAEQLIQAFIADPDLEGDEDSIPTEPVTIDIPIVLNFKSNGIVIWIRAHAAMFLSSDGRWCGLRVVEQLQRSHELHPRFNKSPYPELWITRAWPPIPIEQFEVGVHTFHRQAPEKFVVEARVFPADSLRTGSEQAINP